VRRRAPGLSWLLVAIPLVGDPASAQPQSSEDSQSASETRARQDDAGPSLEFLEFLGTWESSSGEWIDPVEVQSADWPSAADDADGAQDTETGNAN
jgi:hypothetical protein